MTPRVVVCGHWDDGTGYPRTESLIVALRSLGVEVVECRVPAPGRGRLKSELAGAPWRWPGLWLESRRTRARLAAAFARAMAPCRPDAVLVPYPGHVIVRAVRRWFDGQLVLDLFLSAWGTVVEDRELFRPGSLPARMFAALDAGACRAADCVLMDTEDHAQDVASRAGVPRARFRAVPVTLAEPPAFSAMPELAPGERLRLLFFGTGVPLHGLDALVGGVERAPDVHLTLIGGSPEHRALAERRLGGRLDLRASFVGTAELHGALRDAHLVAGVFGRSRKAQLVVPYKIVHALAAGRPVLTLDTPAVQRAMRPGEDCLTVADAAPDSIAAALSSAASDPGRLARIGRRARARFESSFSIPVVAERLREVFGLPSNDMHPATLEPTRLEVPVRHAQ